MVGNGEGDFIGYSKMVPRGSRDESDVYHSGLSTIALEVQWGTVRVGDARDENGKGRRQSGVAIQGTPCEVRQ